MPPRGQASDTQEGQPPASQGLFSESPLMRFVWPLPRVVWALGKQTREAGNKIKEVRCGKGSRRLRCFFVSKSPGLKSDALSLAFSSAIKAVSQGSQGESSRKLHTLGRFRLCQVSQSCFFCHTSIPPFVTQKRTFLKLSVCTVRIPRMLSGVSDGLTHSCRIQHGPRGFKIPVSVHVCICACHLPAS